MAKKTPKQDETDAWPFVRWIEGRQRWQVDARTKDGGERKFFHDKEKAMDFRRGVVLTQANYGSSLEHYAQALKAYGVTMDEALRFAVSHYQKLHASVSLIDAIVALVGVKKLARKSDDYCQRLAYRPGRLLVAFPVHETRTREQVLEFQKIFPKLVVSDQKEQIVNVGKVLSAYTTDELETFLSQFEQAGTRNTFRRDLCTLWSYGATRKWCDATVATTTTIVENENEDEEIEILAVEEVRSLLENGDADTVPGTAISAFCNLRQSELIKRANKKPGEAAGKLLRLDWSDVHLDERVVVVSAKMAKTKKRRTVEIPENAVEWLRPYAKASGPIVPTNFRYCFDRARVKSGFQATDPDRTDGKLQALLRQVKEQGIELKPWPNNGLRHSAISYKVALTRDIAKVATESGNSPAVIAEHYLNLVMPSAAIAYFEIRPPRQEESAFTIGQMRQILGFDESSTDSEVDAAWTKARQKEKKLAV